MLASAAVIMVENSSGDAFQWFHIRAPVKRYSGLWHATERTGLRLKKCYDMRWLRLT